MTSHDPAPRRQSAPRLPEAVRDLDLAIHRAIQDLPTPPGVDRALARLSEAASHSKLWVAIAIVLALTGRPRAAARGTGSLLVASALANLVGKRLFGGARPPGPDRPSRRITDMPTSGSFPSGHSASAAAFTVGASVQSPALAPVLLPLGALVAYTRLHVGAHWFSDVVAGTALGTAVALVSTLVVPVRRSR